MQMHNPDQSILKIINQSYPYLAPMIRTREASVQPYISDGIPENIRYSDLNTTRLTITDLRQLKPISKVCSDNLR